MVDNAPATGTRSGRSLGDRSLRGRLRDLRVRLIADPKFQRFAASFPPTRWIARRKGQALFDLCAGFIYSQILVAFVRLGVAERLLAGPRALDDLASDLALDRAATERLMRGACALGLTEDRGGKVYALADLGSALVGNAGVAEMVAHHAALYEDLRDPVALLRRGGPDRVGEASLERYWGYGTAEDAAALPPQRVGAYSELMAVSVPMIAEDVLDAYPLDRHRRLMDIGGGTGGFAIAAARRHPDLRVAVADLPAVCDLASERFAREGLSDRAEAVGLDFHHDRLPDGADLMTLIRVCFDHGDDRVAGLLSAARQALPPGGRLLLAEAMTDENRPDPVGDAYFGFYLLAMGRGRCRSVETLERMLRAAGFRSVREVATRRPMLARLLLAEV